MIDETWLEPIEFPAWRRRVDLERAAGTLTLHRALALKAILSFNGPDGLFPSDKSIAAFVRVSARTVRRAREDARRLGLLAWDRTRRAVNGRWVQGSNRYRVIVPDSPVCDPAPRPVRRTAGPRIESKKFIESKISKEEAYKGTALDLAAIVAARQAKLAAAWHEARLRRS